MNALEITVQAPGQEAATQDTDDVASAKKLIAALVASFGADVSAVPDAAAAIIDAIKVTPVSTSRSSSPGQAGGTPNLTYAGAGVATPAAAAAGVATGGGGHLRHMDERSWSASNLFQAILTGIIRMAQLVEARHRLLDDRTIAAVEACGAIVKTLASEKSTLVADLVLQLCLEYLICDEARPHVQALLLLFISAFAEHSSASTQDELTYFLVHFVGRINCHAGAETPILLSETGPNAGGGGGSRSGSPSSPRLTRASNAAGALSLATMGMLHAASKKPIASVASTVASLQAAMPRVPKGFAGAGFLVPRLELPRTAYERKRSNDGLGPSVAVSQSLVWQLSLAHRPNTDGSQPVQRELAACGHKIGQLYATVDVKLLLSMKMEMEALSTAAVLRLGVSPDQDFALNSDDDDDDDDTKTMSPDPSPSKMGSRGRRGSSPNPRALSACLAPTAIFHVLKQFMVGAEAISHTVTIVALALFQLLEHRSTCHEALLLLAYSCFHAVERRDSRIVQALCDAALSTTYRRESSIFKIFRQPTTLVGFPLEIANINNIPHDHFMDQWVNVMSMLIEVVPTPWEAIAWTLAALSYYTCNSVCGTTLRLQCGGKCLSLLHSVLELCRADFSISLQFALCLHYILELVDAILVAPNHPEALSTALYAIFIPTNANPIVQIIQSYTRLLYGMPNPVTLFPGMQADPPAAAAEGGGGGGGVAADDTFFWPDKFHMEHHMTRLTRHAGALSTFMRARGARPSIGDHPVDYILNPFTGLALVVLSTSNKVPAQSLKLRDEMLELIVADSICEASSAIHAQTMWVSTYTRFLYISFLMAYNSPEFGESETTVFTRLVLRALVALCSHNSEARKKAFQLGVVSTLVQEVDLEQSVSNMREKHMRRSSSSFAKNTSFATEAMSPMSKHQRSMDNLSVGFPASSSPRTPRVAVIAEVPPAAEAPKAKAVDRPQVRSAPSIMHAPPPLMVIPKLSLGGVGLPQYFLNGGDTQPQSNDQAVSPPPVPPLAVPLAPSTPPPPQADGAVPAEAAAALPVLREPDTAMPHPSCSSSTSSSSCASPAEDGACHAVLEAHRPPPLLLPGTPQLSAYSGATPQSNATGCSNVAASGDRDPSPNDTPQLSLEATPALPPPPPAAPLSALSAPAPKFVMPKLSLLRVPPPLYYTSNGDTAGAASTAILSTPLERPALPPGAPPPLEPMVMDAFLESSGLLGRLRDDQPDSLQNSFLNPKEAPVVDSLEDSLNSQHLNGSTLSQRNALPNVSTSTAIPPLPLLVTDATPGEDEGGRPLVSPPPQPAGLVLSMSFAEREDSADGHTHTGGMHRVRSESSFAVDRGTFPMELLENEPRFMGHQRQSRRIYKDTAVHAELLYLILVLVVLPDGSLDPQYSSSYTFNSKRVNILFFLYAHMNHDANAGPLAMLLQRVADDSSNQGLAVLCKLLVSRAGLSSMFQRCEKLGHGAYGTVLSANIAVEGMLANDVIHPAEWGTSASPPPSQLGGGGDSAAFAASLSMSADAGASVALKLSPVPHHVDDRSAIVTIHHEVLTLMRIQDVRGVCEMYDFGVDGTNYVIVMKKYHGSLLRWRSKQAPGVHTDAMLAVCFSVYRDIVATAVRLHARNIVHNDIKLDNVLMERDASDPTATPVALIRLADFGEAELLHASNPLTSVHTPNKLRGAEATRPPEYLFAKKYGHNGRGEHTAEGHKKADVWAVGCLFFELLAGRPLFPPDDLGTMLRRLETHELVDPSEQSLLGDNKALIRFLEWILNVDPFLRPRMVDVERGLDDLIAQLHIAPTPILLNDGAATAQQLSLPLLGLGGMPPKQQRSPAPTPTSSGAFGLLSASSSLAVPTGRFSSLPEQFLTPITLATVLSAMTLMNLSLQETTGFSRVLDSPCARGGGSGGGISSSMKRGKSLACPGVPNTVNVVRGLLVAKDGMPAVAGLYAQHITHVVDFGLATRISHHFMYISIHGHLSRLYTSMAPLDCELRFEELGLFVCNHVSSFAMEALAAGGNVLIPSLTVGDVDLAIVVSVLILSQLYNVPLLTVFSHVVQRVDPNRQLTNPLKCLRMALVLSQQRHGAPPGLLLPTLPPRDRLCRCLCGDCVYAVPGGPGAQTLTADTRMNLDGGAGVSPGSSIALHPADSPNAAAAFASPTGHSPVSALAGGGAAGGGSAVSHKVVLKFITSVVCVFSRDVLEKIFPGDTFPVGLVTLTRDEAHLAQYGPWLAQLRAAERHAAHTLPGPPPPKTYMKMDGAIHCARCRMPTHFSAGGASGRTVWANMAIPVERGPEVDAARTRSWFTKSHFVSVPQHVM